MLLSTFVRRTAPFPLKAQRLAASVLILVLLATSVAAPGSGIATVVAAPGEQAPPSPLVVTLAATGEDPESVVGPGAPASRAILVQLTLANQSGSEVTDVRVRAPVPPSTRVLDSW